MIFTFPKKNESEKDKPKIRVRHLLKRIFIDDWLMKLVALGITLTLWFGVTRMQAPTTTRLRSVTLNPLIANDLEITNTPLQEVDIVVKGDKGKVDQLSPRNLVASLDLTDIQAGDRTIQITPQNITVDLPSGVVVISVQPDKMAIKLEKVEEHEVPIRVETEGVPASGYEIYSVRSTPEKVRVRGPESFVKALTFVTTEKVDLKGRKSDFTVQQIPLIVMNPKISLVSAATASVFLRVGKRRIERLFVVPYETESRRGRASVLLFGPDTVLEKLSPDDLTIIEEEDGPGKVKLQVRLPSVIRDVVQVRTTKFRE